MAPKSGSEQSSLADIKKQMESLKAQASQQVDQQLVEIEASLSEIEDLVGIDVLAAKVNGFASLKNLLLDLVRDDLAKAEPEKKAASSGKAIGGTRAPSKRYQHPTDPSIVYGGKGPLNEAFKGMANILGVEAKIAALKDYLREETAPDSGVYNDPVKPMPEK